MLTLCAQGRFGIYALQIYLTRQELATKWNKPFPSRHDEIMAELVIISLASTKTVHLIPEFLATLDQSLVPSRLLEIALVSAILCRDDKVLIELENYLESRLHRSSSSVLSSQQFNSHLKRVFHLKMVMRSPHILFDKAKVCYLFTESNH